MNQQVCHEILALEILTLLLENPTDDSVEVAVGFIKEIGLKLSEVSSRALAAIFERMRNILHEASIDKRKNQNHFWIATKNREPRPSKKLAHEDSQKAKAGTRGNPTKEMIGIPDTPLPIQ